MNPVAAVICGTIGIGVPILLAVMLLHGGKQLREIGDPVDVWPDETPDEIAAAIFNHYGDTGEWLTAEQVEQLVAERGQR